MISVDFQVFMAMHIEISWFMLTIAGLTKLCVCSVLRQTIVGMLMIDVLTMTKAANCSIAVVQHRQSYPADRCSHPGAQFDEADSNSWRMHLYLAPVPGSSTIQHDCAHSDVESQLQELSGCLTQSG